MKFRKLVLKNWKNFAAAGVEIAERLFLVGPNASGKSNFLDAFRFLRDLASSGGGFQEAVARRGGVSAIRCLAARREPDIEIGVHLEPGHDQRWVYEVAFNQGQQQASLNIGLGSACDSRRRLIINKEGPASCYARQSAGYQAFVPAPLPPDPPVNFGSALRELLSDADYALGWLGGGRGLPRSRITERLGHAAGDAHRVMNRLFGHPIVNVATVRRWLDVTPAGANQAVNRPVEIGLLREITGYSRNWRFRFDPYLKLFEELAGKPAEWFRPSNETGTAIPRISCSS